MPKALSNGFDDPPETSQGFPSAHPRASKGLPRPPPKASNASREVATVSNRYQGPPPRDRERRGATRSLGCGHCAHRSQRVSEGSGFQALSAWSGETVDSNRCSAESEASRRIRAMPDARRVSRDVSNFRPSVRGPAANARGRNINQKKKKTNSKKVRRRVRIIVIVRMNILMIMMILDNRHKNNKKTRRRSAERRAESPDRSRPSAGDPARAQTQRLHELLAALAPLLGPGGPSQDLRRRLAQRICALLIYSDVGADEAERARASAPAGSTPAALESCPSSSRAAIGRGLCQSGQPAWTNVLRRSVG